MSTEVSQRQAAESPGPQRTPAAVADNAVALSAGATVPAWSDSPRQLKQAEQLTQLQPAAAPASHDGLPENLRSGIEALSGIDMSGVRVHRNSSKPAALQAHAYAQGQDIHLGPGQEKHLPHEAWHVVQQAQGRVRPTVQMKAGVAINDDAALEREADVMGARALQHHGSATQRQPVANRRTDTYIVARQAAGDRTAQLNPFDTVRKGFGMTSTAIGIGTAALLASNPFGWGVGAAMLGSALGGMLATAGSSYMLAPADPDPIRVNGSFVDGLINWSYSYDVSFAYPTATIELDFYIAGGRVSEEARSAYIDRMKEKVSEVFDNKIHIELNKLRYNTLVEVNVAFDDSQARISFDDREPVRKLSLHDTLGRSNAMNFHVNSDPTGYVGAHEVGHHLGLVDEYSDPALSPYRTVYHDNGIMTGPPPDPVLPKRNIDKIKSDIEQAVAERTRRQQQEQRLARSVNNGELPI